MAEEPQRCHVLVVDDEEDVRQLVCKILRERGHEAEPASDGEQALEKVKGRRPDLMVLDLMMPGTDGWAVLQRLRELPDPPPVLLLTARADYDSFARGVREGATAFVPKPFRLQELLSLCDKMLTYSAKTGPAPARERRREPRRAVMVEVRVLSKESAPVTVGEITDLSLNGARLNHEAPFPPGERITLAVNVPGGPGLTLDCRVEWWQGTASGPVVHGLSFHGLRPEDRRLLEELLGPASW